MDGGLTGGIGPSAHAGFVLPLRPRAQLAILALGVVIIVDLVALVVDINFLSLVNRLLDGESISLADADAADNHFSDAGVAQLIAVGVSAVTYLLWYTRAYRNVMTMGLTKPRQRMSIAVVSWFVPFVALVVPKQIVDDIYRTSDPEMPFGDPNYTSRPVAPLLGWWWAAWLIGAALDRYASFTRDDAKTASEIITNSKLFIAADALNAFAAVLATLVILRITERNEARMLRFGGSGSPQPPAPGVVPPAVDSAPLGRPLPPPLPPPAPPQEPTSTGHPPRTESPSPTDRPTPPPDKSGSFGPPGYTDKK